jgi:CHAT domain-containing protein
MKFRSSLLTAGAKATVVTAERWATEADLNKLLADLDPRVFTPAKLPAFGDRLAKLVLANEVLAVLPSVAGQHLAIVHDAMTSRLPWETLRCGDWQPALSGGVSRRYLAENLSVAKWLEERRSQPTLEVLLVVNPTEDLSGAEEEGERIAALFGAHPSVRLTRRDRGAARRATLLNDFRSGQYDLVHYAGHAAFDPVHRSRSGILCAGHEVLSGADLSGLGNLPNLVVFNACESGRVRGGTVPAAAPETIRQRVEKTVGLAEAFLRGGVANYVGTYWPVGDEPAKVFAQNFYGTILEGKAVGQALISARTAVYKLPAKTVDWADYIHYGNPHFVLKLR